MERRSINTTKSGKNINPTDRARKEVRKKELKKNKKQRQLVRAAVLKGKDPVQIIEEMEKIDRMEYNVMQPPPLNERVLKDKRKKLKQTLDRILQMYAKDDQEKWMELKQQLIQYERRRIDMVTYFEAVRHAQQVQVDEIPLPSAANDIFEVDTETGSKASGKWGSSSGKSEEEEFQPPGASDRPPGHNQHASSHPFQQHTQHAMPPIGLPPPPLLYRPPPLPMHLRMPSPPSPRIGLRLPPGPPPGMLRLLRPSSPSMPRLPPPQMQSMTNLANSQFQTQASMTSPSKTSNVLSAAPQFINRKDKDGKSATMIKAKPQIRNLAADVTRFLPTSLHVKRDDRKKPSPIPRLVERLPEVQPLRATQPKTKDDAYMQFMQEMEEICRDKLL